MTRDDIREYHRRRRARAKTLGICIECNEDKALEARTKCRLCLMNNALAIQRKRAA